MVHPLLPCPLVLCPLPLVLPLGHPCALACVVSRGVAGLGLIPLAPVALAAEVKSSSSMADRSSLGATLTPSGRDATSFSRPFMPVPAARGGDHGLESLGRGPEPGRRPHNAGVLMTKGDE